MNSLLIYVVWKIPLDLFIRFYGVVGLECTITTSTNQAESGTVVGATAQFCVCTNGVTECDSKNNTLAR
jgi:hypothetical protein